MKESYEQELATQFGLQRRGGCGNVTVLSVRGKGSAGQPLSSEITPFVCRSYVVLEKAIPQLALRLASSGHGGVVDPVHAFQNLKRENREVLSVSFLMRKLNEHLLIDSTHRWSDQKTPQAVPLV